VYAMQILPENQRKGAGHALLRAAAESAAAEDMQELYLLVEEHNVAARALYKKAGFADVYRYHYRVRDLS
jgi:ribosomal protein S18 acetylase RimI-like enzyme